MDCPDLLNNIADKGYLLGVRLAVHEIQVAVLNEGQIAKKHADMRNARLASAELLREIRAIIGIVLVLRDDLVDVGVQELVGVLDLPSRSEARNAPLVEATEDARARNKLIIGLTVGLGLLAIAAIFFGIWVPFEGREG